MTIVRAADIAPHELRMVPIADLRQQMRRDRERDATDDRASFDPAPADSRDRIQSQQSDSSV